MDSLRREWPDRFLLDRVKLAVASTSKVTSNQDLLTIRVIVDIQ